jgi:hypothetical protein
MIPQIKTIYAPIQKYQSILGTHWDNENGAGIEGSSAAAVGDSYVSQKVCLISTFALYLMPYS